MSRRRAATATRRSSPACGRAHRGTKCTTTTARKGSNARTAIGTSDTRCGSRPARHRDALAGVRDRRRGPGDARRRARCSRTSSSGKQEAFDPFYRVVELNDTIDDPAVWGRNFPHAVRRLPPHRRPGAHALRRQRGAAAHADGSRPARARRAVAARGGPAAARVLGGLRVREDFREERGHAYMLEDQMFTERQHVTQQPGTCLHCHASVTRLPARPATATSCTASSSVNRMPYLRGRGARGAPRRLHRLPRSRQHAAARHAARFIEGMRVLHGRRRASRTTT